MNLKDRTPRKVEFAASYSAQQAGKDREAVAPLDEANVICSDSQAGGHLPVIDLDVPGVLIPSSTQGHAHLYLDHEVDWADYLDLLEALAKCGLVEQGYVEASKQRGFTAVRLPWVKKWEPAEPIAPAFDFDLDPAF